MPELREDEIAVLYAAWEAAHGSIKAHPPAQAIRNKLTRPYRKIFQESLNSLRRRPERYIVKHPTRGEMTYQVTRNGRDKLLELGLISFP